MLWYIFVPFLLLSIVLKGNFSQYIPPGSPYVQYAKVGPPSLQTGLPNAGKSLIRSSVTSFPTQGITFASIREPYLPTARKLAPSMPPPSSNQYPFKPSYESPDTLNSIVINNLAKALQLLIVSNILSMPLPESTKQSCKPPEEVSRYPVTNVPFYDQIKQPIVPVSVAYTSVGIPPTTSLVLQPQAPQTFYQILPNQAPRSGMLTTQNFASYYLPNDNPINPYANDPPVLPNANFVGSSYVDTGSIIGSMSNPYGTRPPSPRTSLALMSPYDAINQNSPFTDPILSSPYGSVMTSKKDFQSPYSSILANDNNNDLFSMDYL